MQCWALAQQAILTQVPEVQSIVARLGFDQLGLDPIGLYETDTFLVLNTREQWRGTKEDMAEAQTLAQRVQQLERQVGAEFETCWLQLAQQEQAVLTLRAAAATQRLAADKSLTAYTLGEYSMTELIQNRRLANEQQLASQRLLLEATHNRAQLDLDAHRLWDLDD